MREDAFTKARRYITEGRLIVTRVNHDRIDAVCRGDGHVYKLGLNRIWHCNCPAVTADCAHLRALRLVTNADPFNEWSTP